ncbi:hypothetical protein KUCAC02_004446 [Chaenocephalus aceratus]|uniref:Uncharacterized protein n=1 Tax=Chaenocephalus aceratus TaxID=36190 RepID=A0ACB9WZH0_CHAAC|nr:hypothetical protein KUCAC02_004446 [Chaenocephalus aceratus]
MAYYDDETTRKKKAAALLLLMHLREHDEQLLQGRGKPRRRRKPRSVWVRKWLSEKRRERYGHYSTLLNELKTEDEKAFFNYTRLPRGLYDEVLRRVEGRIEKKDTWFQLYSLLSLILFELAANFACLRRPTPLSQRSPALPTSNPSAQPVESIPAHRLNYLLQNKGQS